VLSPCLDVDLLFHAVCCGGNEKGFGFFETAK